MKTLFLLTSHRGLVSGPVANSPDDVGSGRRTPRPGGTGTSVPSKLLTDRVPDCHGSRLSSY